MTDERLRRMSVLAELAGGGSMITARHQWHVAYAEDVSALLADNARLRAELSAARAVVDAARALVATPNSIVDRGSTTGEVMSMYRRWNAALGVLKAALAKVPQ